MLNLNNRTFTDLAIYNYLELVC